MGMLTKVIFIVVMNITFCYVPTVGISYQYRKEYKKLCKWFSLYSLENHGIIDAMKIVNIYRSEEIVI